MTDDHNRQNCDIGGCDICMSYGDLMRLVADENSAKRQAEAADEIERLRAANVAWMNGVADAVEPLGYDRDAACGPADLLPGLRDLHAIPPGVWRVTVHDDGTIEVAGLLEFNWRLRTADELRGDWWVEVPTEPEPCGSRGPRIGHEGVPLCRQPKGHKGPHRPNDEDGWGIVTWPTEPEDGARD